MSDLSRQNSPKSSPRGSRSPAYPRQDSSGTLKTTISLGKNPAIVHTGPFYLMKELPEPSEMTGSTNLMAYHGLEHSFNKCSGKKMKEELSSFLPTLPGNIDQPGSLDNSSLRSLIEKPPITGKELHPLTGLSLSGFRLHPGPLPETYNRLFSQQVPQKRKKHKKHKKEGKEAMPETQAADNMLNFGLGDEVVKTEITNESGIDHKKRKEKTKDDAKKKEKKKKKKKKEKEKDEKPVV